MYHSLSQNGREIVKFLEGVLNPLLLTGSIILIISLIFADLSIKELGILLMLGGILAIVSISSWFYTSFFIWIWAPVLYGAFSGIFISGDMESSQIILRHSTLLSFYLSMLGIASKVLIKGFKK